MIVDVYVTPPRRRCGLASHLIARAAELASRAQLQHVFAAIAADDPAHRRLAERSGFATLLSFEAWLPRSDVD